MTRMFFWKRTQPKIVETILLDRVHSILYVVTVSIQALLYRVRHKLRMWNFENHTKSVYLHKIVTANAENILRDQLAYFLNMLHCYRRVQSSFPWFILNTSCLLELPYELQNRRIWQCGRTIRELSMKCLFHTTIRAGSIISFQHKNQFLH